MAIPKPSTYVLVFDAGVGVGAPVAAGAFMMLKVASAGIAINR